MSSLVTSLIFFLLSFTLANLPFSRHTLAVGPVAQLVEPPAHNRIVVGSKPAGSTTKVKKPVYPFLECGLFLFNSPPQKTLSQTLTA